MLNMIKMDLYRMLKTKSAYVIMMIMVLIIALTSWLEVKQEEIGEDDYAVEMTSEDETLNFGMSVSIAAEPGENVTVFDMFYANSQAKFLALFLVIFAVIFSTADIGSGYIKNIGGQVRGRWKLMCSKAFALFVYTVVFLAVYLLAQAVSNRIFAGYLEWGDGKAFCTYLALSALLSFALEMICMAVAVFVRNNVFSIILAVCLCMNLMVIVYSAIDKLLAKAGVVKDFQLLEYTVTGKLALLVKNPTGAECLQAVVVGLVFSAVTILFSSVIFEKRDI